MTLQRNPDPGTVNRRRFLAAAGGLLGAAAVGGGAYEAVQQLSGEGFSLRPRLAARAVGSSGSAAHFHTRPDLRPATVQLSGDAEAAPGHLFIGPYATDGAQPGPLIVDRAGQPLWFRPVSETFWATNFRPWNYRGQPVLAWWEGKVLAPGFGQGKGTVLDAAYRPLARIQAAAGRQMDIHELQLTPEGTALFTCFPPTVSADLTAVGGPRDGKVRESVFQEVDLRTGRLLLEWRSLEHIGVEESHLPVSEPYDYMHLNSIEVTSDGQLLISGRHTWALYKLERRTGKVIWRLGGKRSDFELERGAQFAWQHDGRQPSPGRITVFDDGSNGPIKTESQSRGLVLAVDEPACRVRVAHEYRHPGKPLLAAAMGSTQILPDGHVVVGWGTAPYVSEFAAAGRLLADAEMAKGQQSYRGMRFPWQGTPRDSPAITASTVPGGHTLYASWNGSSETAAWRVLAGPSRGTLRPLGYALRRGFETAIPIRAAGAYAAVAAVDRSGRVLGVSRAIRL